MCAACWASSGTERGLCPSVGGAEEVGEVLDVLTGRGRQPTSARPWNVSAAEPVLDRQTGYTTEVTDVARDQGEPIGQHN
jgi:hypothetical protein